MNNKPFTHILQKKGILRTFSVAKVVRKKDIEELKSIIKQLASNEEEYDQMLKEEMERLSDMHNSDNPIPGIIYSESDKDKRRKVLYVISDKFVENLGKQKFTKQELALLISSMIAKLELDQDDFAALNKDLTEELENYDERDSDYDDEEDKEYGEDDEEDDF
jgi:hypothetical protein